MALCSVLFYIIVSSLLDFLFQEQSLWARTKLTFFRYARKIPFVQKIISDKLREPLAVNLIMLSIYLFPQDIQHGMFKHAPPKRFPKLPQHGLPSQDLLQLLKKDYEHCGDPIKRLKEGKV